MPIHLKGSRLNPGICALVINNPKMNIKIILSLILTILLNACSQKQGDERKESSTDIDSTKTCIISDDSLITVYWWDTGEGGTAPDIEAVCRFKTESGDIKEEARPLLSIVHPDEDYSHHEVSKIVSLDTEHGRRVYFFYLRAKAGSNEYAHDIITMKIEGDSLVPINMMKVGDETMSHIGLETSI